MRQSRLAEMSVKKPVTMTMLFCAILAIGALAYTRIPIQLLPGGFTPPFLYVRVPYRNGTPREVEKYVTRPIEEALATVRNIKSMNSRSGANACTVWMEFRDGTDMDAAYAEVRDRLDRAQAEFPEDTERPSVFKMNPNSEPIMEIAISYPEDVTDLGRIERRLTRELERIPGVAKLEFEGLVDESIRIEIDRDKARATGVNLYALVQRLRVEDFSMGAGTIQEGGREHALRSVAVLDGREAVAALPVADGVVLGDVAQVRPALSLRDVISRIDGKPAFSLDVFKESEANTVEVCAAVRKVLAEELPRDPELSKLNFLVLGDAGELITDSIGTLKESALIGAALSLAIVWFFLLRLRLSLLINLAVPVSLLVTFSFMYFSGDTLNIVSLMGLTLAVGMLVDNSVVVSENIDRLRALGVPPREAAMRGASEVALAVILSTLTSVVVFLPLALMSGDGMMQFFMGKLAIPVCVSLGASLLVSLALLPAAAAFLAGHRTPKALPPVRWSASATGAVLGWCLRHRLETALLALAVFASTWIPFDKLEKSLEPKEASNDIQVYFNFTTGRNLSEANRLMKQIEAVIDARRAELEVANVRTRFREQWGRMTLYLTRVKRTEEERSAIEAKVKKLIPVLAGVEASTSWRGAGESRGGKVQVSLIGDDSEVLAKVSEDVKRRLKLLPGVSDVTTDLEKGTDEIRVRVDRARAAMAGIDSQVASGTVSTSLRGARLPDLRVGGREVPLILQFPEDERENLVQLSSITLYGSSSSVGARQAAPQAAPLDSDDEAPRPIPLAAVADFEFAKGLSSINHDNRKTSLGVTVTAAGEDTLALSEQVRTALASFQFPHGYGFDMGGWNRRWRQEQGDYGFSMAMSLIFVFLIMGILFESWILPFSILSAIPFSLFGVYWFLWMTNTTLDLMGMIGVVILIGVVVNNAIVLLDRILQLRSEGVDRATACRTAVVDRFRPIWITALTTIAGLLPMAFGTQGIAGVPYAPLARTVIGGLAASTVITLVVVPVMYTVFDDVREGAQGWVRRLRGRRTV